MRDNHESSQPQKEQREIRRLIAHAAEQQHQDCYEGKREERRFHASIRLEVMMEWADGVELVNGTLHDISAGGISFRTRQVVQVRPSVFVREFTPEGNAVWIGTNLTHCTRGLNGFLVGAQFHHPVSPHEVTRSAKESAAPPATGETDAQPELEKKRGWLARLGLS